VDLYLCSQWSTGSRADAARSASVAGRGAAMIYDWSMQRIATVEAFLLERGPRGHEFANP
jgi:hypothetical protein